MKTITIGGQFESCVYISIKYQSGRAIEAKIPQIYSEPECDLVNVLGKGGAPNMIKASLQFIHAMEPEIQQFSFSDMSKVDCKKLEHVNGLPRRLIMPLPLNALYIALNGKTWYEHHFNAQLKNTTSHNAYRKGIKNLYLSTAKNSLTWDQMRWNFNIVNEYVDIMGEIYDRSRTFSEFFNAIPKNIQCKAFSGWLEPFMDKWLGKSYRTDEWVINVNQMMFIPIEITDRLLGGGRRKRRAKPADGYFIVNGD